MHLDWLIHESLIQKILSHSYQMKHHMWLCDSGLLWLSYCYSLFGIKILVELVT